MKKKILSLVLSGALLSCITLSSCEKIPFFNATEKTVSRVYFNDDGELIIVYSDKTEENVGVVNTPPDFDDKDSGTEDTSSSTEEDTNSDDSSSAENDTNGDDGSGDNPPMFCSHVYGAWKKELDPSCEGMGFSTRVCELCEDVDYNFVAPLGHSYGETTTIVNSYEQHLVSKTCSVCNNTIVENLALESRSIKNVFYGSGTYQMMDVHLPKNLKEGEIVPVVMTVHGGSWWLESKALYDYISEFITDDCGYVHVNINYRLTGGYPSGNSITYVDMLDDIRTAIHYLSNNTARFHADVNKLALMGHSAGAHLAMLYAYTNPKEVDLLIAEAAPTRFVDVDKEVLSIDPAICAMAGIPFHGEDYVHEPNNCYNVNIDRDLSEALALRNASPLWVANDYINAQAEKPLSQQVPLPYTVFAYGGTDSDKDGVVDRTSHDGILSLSNLYDLLDILKPTQYQSFTFPGVSHNSFGAGDESKNIRVFPGSKHAMIQEYYYGKFNGETLVTPGLKQIFQEKLGTL